MTTASDIVSILQRQGPQLFQGNQNIYNRLELAISDMDFQGLALAAPTQIPLASKPELPVVLASQQTVMRGWLISAQYNLMLVISDLNTGKTQVSRVTIDAKDEESGDSMRLSRPPKPSEQAGKGIETKVQKVDALTKFGIPWRPGEYMITAISYNWKSNSAVVRVLGDKPAAVETLQVSPRPAQTQLPTYLANPKTPKLTQEGMAFMVDESSNAKRIIITGALIKTLRENELVGSSGMIMDHNSTQEVVAVVPLNFLVMGVDWKQPRIRAVGAPVYGINAPIGHGFAKGYFQLDIAGDQDTALPPGQYAIYAIMDGMVYGPQKLEIE